MLSNITVSMIHYFGAISPFSVIEKAKKLLGNAEPISVIFVLSLQAVQNARK